MELRDILTILAILFSPMVALGVAAWMRGSAERSRRQYEVVYDLARAKAALLPPHLNKDVLEGALNAIPMVFCKNEKIVDAYEELAKARARGEPEESSTEKLVSLILLICQEKGYKEVRKSAIETVLQVAKDAPR